MGVDTMDEEDVCADCLSDWTCSECGECACWCECDDEDEEDA